MSVPRRDPLETFGSPAFHLTLELIGRIAETKYLATYAAMKAKAEDLRRSITPADVCPLERLLAERVVVCWLAAYAADLAASRRDSAGASPREMEALARRSDRAHRRFLTGVRALATLAIP